ncbi:hypothetical protein OAJ86_00200 [Nitrosopumilus sp.]|nr:hypothetical protein [Nitrosopumilus sp.]
MKDIIALEHYRNVIPESDFRNPDFKGVKFLTIYNEFVRLGIKGARNKNKVLKDLDYYVQLGFFGRIHNETYKQPIFYQTHIGGDLVTDTGLLDGLKFVKSILDTKFEKIETEWEKLDKEKLFLKNKKTKRGNLIPSKKLDRWIMLFDPVIVITQNLMWTRETMDYDMLKNDYSKLIKDTIKEISKFAIKVHSTSKENEKYVEAVFRRIPFRINF